MFTPGLVGMIEQTYGSYIACRAESQVVYFCEGKNETMLIQENERGNSLIRAKGARVRL
jgi:hypothetical protein